MELVFFDTAGSLPYAKLGESTEGKQKFFWIFPDIESTFGSIIDDNGKIIIDPSYYYITSGEAIKKTEVLIADIRDQMEKYIEDEHTLTKLSDMLLMINDFLELLIETRGPSQYLEVTKCEDGLYSGNVCARKDKKKKKAKIAAVKK
jgi:hypothetical protein